jgi:hypothetical protein
MIEKLLLHVQYECQRQGVQIPWDKVVHRLSPGSSGATAQQHLNKVRDQLVAEGHMVPPLIGKLGAPAPDAPRGFIRDMSQNDPYVTKAVHWGDHVEDRKDSLVEEGIIRGSGTYRKYEVAVNNAVETHVKRTLSTLKIKDQSIPKDLAAVVSKPIKYEGLRKGNNPRLGSSFHKTKYAGREDPLQKVNPRGAAKRGSLAVSKQAQTDIDDLEDNKGTLLGVKAGKTVLPPRKPRLTKSPLFKEEEDDEANEADQVDPAELSSDDDYTPGLTSKPAGRTRRSRRKAVTYKETVESDVDDIQVTPTKTTYDSDEPMTPPGSGLYDGQGSAKRLKPSLKSTQTMLSESLRQTNIADVPDSAEFELKNMTGINSSPSAMRRSRMHLQKSYTGFDQNDFMQNQFPAEHPDLSENGDFDNTGSFEGIAPAEPNEKHLHNAKTENPSPQKMSGARSLFAGSAEESDHSAANTLVAASHAQFGYGKNGMLGHFRSVNADDGHEGVAIHGGITPARNQPQLTSLPPATLGGNHFQIFSQMANSEQAFDTSRAQTVSGHTTDGQGHHNYQAEPSINSVIAQDSFVSESTNDTPVSQHNYRFDGLPAPASGGDFGFGSGWNGTLDDVFNDNPSYPEHAQDGFHLWDDEVVVQDQDASYMGPNGNFSRDFGN